MGRAPCCDKANVKKGPWSPEEDAKLKEYIEKHGTGGNWIALPQKAGLRRCGKSCRLRWLNYLRPNIKHGEFSDDENRIIFSLFASIGSRWSIIAGQLPGRTDNDIKNHWNTKLKKKLTGNTMAPSTQYQRRPHQPTMYPTPPNSFLLQEPSLISSLNSQIPLSYEYDSTNCCYNSTQVRAFSRTYEPIYPNFTSVFSSNPIGPDGFLGPARGSFDDQGYYSNVVDDENQKLLLSSTNQGYSSSSLSSSSTAANEGCSFGDNPLDYGIEEIKQLLSTTDNSNMCNILNFFVDEIIKKEEN